MKSAIIMGIGLVIGGMILGTGLFYLIKEKDNAESRKIYGITCLAGIAIIAGILIKAAISGF